MRALTVYYEHRPGGMMQMIYRMLLAGAERGGEMHYLSVSPYRLRHDRLHAHRLPAPRRHDTILFWAWFFLAAPCAALWIAWRQRLDLLAVFEGVYAWVVLPAKLVLRLPLVVFLQSDVATINRLHRRASGLRRIEQWMEGAGLRRAERIVVTNRALGELVRARWRLAPERIEVVPNNVAAPVGTSPEARTRLRAEVGLPADAFAIATSGVFSPRKNLPLLLAAFAEVAAPRAHLIVIGAGTDDGEWRRLIERTKAGPNGARVHFLGWRSDVVDVLAGCDLFVFPTRHEGSPLSLIEALRVGLPCLGSDIDEIREVLGDDPRCLFDPDDAAGLRARLERAAGDPDFLGEIGRMAGKRAEAYDFDWEAKVAAILAAAHAGERPADSPPARARGTLVRLYERATGTTATARTAAVVERFGPYLIGMMAAKGLSTLGQLLISRLLGPAEVGRLAVVLSTSTLIALPLAGAWGATFVRYAAGRDDWAPLLRATGTRALGAALALAALVILLAPLLAPWLHLTAGLLVAGALLGVAMAAWLLAKAASQAREDWRRFVSSELAFGAMTCALPLVCVLLGRGRDVPCPPAGWLAATLLFAMAYALGVVPAWGKIKAAARSVAALDAASGRFARFALLTGAANTVFLYSDRFAAQRVLGFDEVGVYYVYSFSTVGVALLLATLLHNFAFPLFPQGDRRAFAALFLSGFLRLLPLTLAGLFAAGWLQIYVAGFPFRPLLLFIATLSAAALMVSGFYGQLTLSAGVEGSRLCARVAGVTLVLYAIGVLPAVRLGGLGGLFAFYAVLYAGTAIYYARALRSTPVESVEAAAAPS